MASLEKLIRTKLEGVVDGSDLTTLLANWAEAYPDDYHDYKMDDRDYWTAFTP